MGSMTERITSRQFHATEGLKDWRVIEEGACAYFRTGSFAAGARLVQAIAGLGDLDPHEPDVDLRHDGVTVRLIRIADDYYGMTARHVELAREISRIAADQGLTADTAAVQSLLVVPGGAYNHSTGGQ